MSEQESEFDRIERERFEQAVATPVGSLVANKMLREVMDAMSVPTTARPMPPRDVWSEMLDRLRARGESEINRRHWGDPTIDLLTEKEKEAIETAGQAASLIFAIIKEGGGFEADAAEIAQACHVLQRFVMSNAAARAHPGKYRKLGAENCG
jgi:hypothetical protein